MMSVGILVPYSLSVPCLGRGNHDMPDVDGRRDIQEEDSLGANGLQGFPKQTRTKRSGVLILS
jgi:hypothetical protein